MSNQKATALLELRTKLFALCQEVPDHVFLQDGNQQSAFVQWLTSYSKRAIEITAGPQTYIQPTERDLISAYRGFSNSQKVVDFCEKHKITLPHGQHWWMMNPDERPARISGFDGKADSVNGKIDASRGVPRITNGIDVYIERGDGTLFLGHRDWLVWERKPRNSDEKQKTESSPSETSKSFSPRVLETATKLVQLGDLSLFAEKYQSVFQQQLEVKLSGNREADVRNVSVALDKYLERLAEV